MDRSAAFATKIRDAFAARSLGYWPTPLEAEPGLARALGLEALWLKREDRAGGNKVRGLEFVFAGVPPRSTFVTVGGSGSTHCLSTARLARAEGHRTAVAVFAQPETEESRRIAARTAETADVVIAARHVLALPWAVVRAWRAARRLGAARPRWIPGGAAEPRAVLGHLLAALELEHQLDAPPDAIVVPLGTGGTAAGIALGVAWLGWPTTVIGARVAPLLVANRWRTLRLARRAVTLLRRAGIAWLVPQSAVRVRVVNVMGAGYGYPTREGELARALAADHNVRLDPTYGAKAFSSLMSRRAQMRRAIFWHTFPSY
ncbi:MAG TPA: pyridoxal-phosphate dependent enzyme [Gemmatimonadales bacterium]|nr:pyridoxal-phosphate dependent enzyme [Gemmatimonadales bacterium]